MAQRPTTTCTKFRLITTMGVMVNGPFLTKIFAELKTEKTTICELRPPATYTKFCLKTTMVVDGNRSLDWSSPSGWNKK